MKGDITTLVLADDSMRTILLAKCNVIFHIFFTISRTL